MALLGSFVAWLTDNFTPSNLEDDLDEWKMAIFSGEGTPHFTLLRSSTLYHLMPNGFREEPLADYQRELTSDAPKMLVLKAKNQVLPEDVPTALRKMKWTYQENCLKFCLTFLKVDALDSLIDLDLWKRVLEDPQLALAGYILTEAVVTVAMALEKGLRNKKV